MQSNPLTSQTALGLPPQAAGIATPNTAQGLGAPASGVNKGFQQVWAEVRPRGQAVNVESGDTLIGLVKAHYRQNGQEVSEGRAFNLAHQVARENRVQNPDLIVPGQKIDFSALKLPTFSRAALAPLNAFLPDSQINGGVKPTPTAADMLAQRSLSAAELSKVSGSTPASSVQAKDSWAQHPILERTLERAANKGFVPVAQLPEVKQKIVALAQRYNFAPDDFARLSLMESGGLNPQATNGSCHGIIQFCDGENRGAAAVGLKDKPRSILGMGLLQQLDLVDKYFSQAGLSPKGPRLGLDDLYLTVLTPAARQETRPDAPLPIAGPQARSLHVGGDTRGPITRNSILSGLHALTNALLEPSTAKSAGSRWYANVDKSAANPLR